MEEVYNYGGSMEEVYNYGGSIQLSFIRGSIQLWSLAICI